MTGYQASTKQMKTLPVINPTFKSEWFSIVIVGDKMCRREVPHPLTQVLQWENTLMMK